MEREVVAAAEEEEEAAEGPVRHLNGEASWLGHLRMAGALVLIQGQTCRKRQKRYYYKGAARSKKYRWQSKREGRTTRDEVRKKPSCHFFALS